MGETPHGRVGQPSVAKYTFIDIFSGCGGAALGFMQEGFVPVAAIENDEVSARSYLANVGLAPMVRDVRDVTGPDLLQACGLKPGQIDVMIGCAPCQGFSTQRRDRGAGRDERNRLLVDFVRLVSDLKPAVLVFENVPGLVGGSGRWRFRETLAALRKLGYSMTYQVVQAADYGVPQLRQRLLALGSRLPGVVKFPAQTHARPTSDAAKPAGLPAWRTVRDAIGTLPVLQSGEWSGDDEHHHARKHRPIALARLRAIPPNGGSRRDLPKKLRLACHVDHDGHKDVYGRMWWDRASPTLTSGCTNVTRGRFAHPEQDRAITEREALLLQGFPPGATIVGTSSQRAAQIGNSVPPPLSQAAARSVRKHLEEVATSAAS